ncbi:DUF2780 domain-containing protein [Polycladidibacter stylochi]|uniref:DUF2780 domain-containing protein n=1 Tax=Polycladidibacter stylochi TaxID=1807766 RepID=UPI00082F4056|nr:DUF2780 domain-containing protein [Pseudovibrio stylochi]
MHYLVDNLVNSMEISEEQAETAVGEILNYISKHISAQELQEIFDMFPYAKVMLAKAEAAGSQGMLGGLASPMSGSISLLAALDSLTSQGLSMEQIHEVAHTTIRYAKSKLGEEKTERILNKVPDLKAIG